MTSGNGRTMVQRVEEMAGRAADFDIEEAADRVHELGEQIESGLRDANRRVRAELKELGLNEATIPDAFRKAPKLISPKVHAWLDFGVTGYFLGLGILFASRRKKGAAVAAFVNAGMVAGVSMMTDYEGSGKKPISFKMHGTLDAVQAATAAMAPALHGFAGEPESAFFYGQAANEVAVIATTDWDAGMRRKARRK
jgi:hypothetical protein